MPHLRDVPALLRSFIWRHSTSLHVPRSHHEAHLHMLVSHLFSKRFLKTIFVVFSIFVFLQLNTPQFSFFPDPRRLVIWLMPKYSIKPSMPTLLSLQNSFNLFLTKLQETSSRPFPSTSPGLGIRSNFIDFLFSVQQKTLRTSSTNRSLMFPEMQLNVTNA